MGKVIVTGGAGFIGSALIRHLITATSAEVVNIDALTYAGNLASLKDIDQSPRYRFVKMDICDPEISRLIHEIQPDGIIHLAAESHVDRSIENPLEFVRTNVLGTANLLHAALGYFKTLPDERKAIFRFQHVSTDEVYGSLAPSTGQPSGTGQKTCATLFDETSPYNPSSPYSASKAGSDHLVRAWGHTYGLPILICNGSNTYGPYQFPEKLIPLVITNALQGKALPIYGNGQQVRDWIHVDDHAKALWLIHERGTPGESYAIGSDNPRTNLAVVHALCRLLDELRPRQNNVAQAPSPVAKSTLDTAEGGCATLVPQNPCYADLIAFVPDRPGHDVRYALNTTKLRHTLHWHPETPFDSGLRSTVLWYLAHSPWWFPLLPKTCP